MTVHAFHEPTNAVIPVRVGDSPIDLLFFGPDEELLAPGQYGVRHICGRWPDADEPDGEFIKVVAPRLSDPGHTFAYESGRPTITPSIACPDCGLHGFITQGEWRDA